MNIKFPLLTHTKEKIHQPMHIDARIINLPKICISPPKSSIKQALVSISLHQIFATLTDDTISVLLPK